MTDTGFFAEMSRRLAELLPPGSEQFKQDMERNFQAVLRSGFSRLDLVTREEFEVQSAVLARSREKLERLEKRIAELEAQAAE